MKKSDNMGGRGQGFGEPSRAAHSPTQPSFDSMVGTLQWYRGHQYVIKQIIYQGDNRYDVVTDKKVIKETEKGLGSEFTLLQTREELVNSNALVLSIGSRENTMNKVADAILASIEKLRNGECKPEDIEKARAINESAQVMTNMARVQLEYMKAARELR